MERITKGIRFLLKLRRRKAMEEAEVEIVVVERGDLAVEAVIEAKEIEDSPEEGTEVEKEVDADRKYQLTI
jgi:hypothetical protein